MMSERGTRLGGAETQRAGAERPGPQRQERK